MNTLRVPFVQLGLQYKNFREEIFNKVDELSSKGQYVLGQEVETFEKSFAKYCGTRHAVSVANGTDALILLLRAYGIGSGDEVVTAPNSFIATAGAVAMVGARTTFADVGKDYNLDPDRLEGAITERTKAIIPVHLTGMPADMGAISAIAEKHRLVVIEDAAQAIGATFKGKKVGSLGQGGAFSLHPLKNLHVHGDGGMITLDDDNAYAQLLKLRNHGLVNRDECEFFSVNSRLDTIQAAIGNIKMPHLDRITARFKEIAQQYANGLEGAVELPIQPIHREGVFHNFVIQVDDRKNLQDYLLKRGIETKVHYPVLLHLQPAAKSLGYKLGDFPEAERQSQRILSLPIYPELDDEQVQWVVSSIRDYYSEQ